MQRMMLKSKIHRVSVTHAELNYGGSCAIRAARKAQGGDILIVAAYAAYDEGELARPTPDLVYFDALNRIKSQAQQIPLQAV